MVIRIFGALHGITKFENTIPIDIVNPMVFDIITFVLSRLEEPFRSFHMVEARTK